MTTTATTLPPRRARPRRPDAATQCNFVWRRFRKHRLALAGVAIIAFLSSAAYSQSSSHLYGPSERNPRYVVAPMLVRVMDADGFHLRPFVFGRKMSRDPVTLRPEPIVDETSQWPLQFFVRGQEYSFWGLFRSDFHLFGTENGFIHLFGTDDLGRDVFSRNLYAARVSLSVGLIGVSVAFVLGTLIGGVAGYFGGLVDNLIMRLIEFIRSIPTLPLWLALSAALPRDWSALQVYLAITLILALIGWTGWRGPCAASSWRCGRRVRDGREARRLQRFPHHRPASAARFYELSDRRSHDILPGDSAGGDSAQFPGPWIAGACGELGRDAECGAEHPCHRPFALAAIPGGFVILAVLAFNFAGDGLRDAADPYAK
jgi:peptide/nickel transport system permease protein